MALGERFTRSAVACEFSSLPILRTARGDAFCDPRWVLWITSRPSVRRERRLASKAVRCVLIAVAMRLAQVGRERGSVRNRVYALMVAPTVIYMLILVASLAASVRSLKPTAHFYRGTETPMFAIWRLGDDPFNRYRVNAGTDGGHI